MTKKPKPSSSTIALNKKAKFDYFIEDRYEAGLVLHGWEVKSLRDGKGNITESYIVLQNAEAWLVGAHFTPLKTASTHVVAEPMRARKLLLNRKELEKLIGAKEKKGFTIVPLALYWKNNLVKVEIGTGKGKKQHDKRATIKDRESKRDLSRVVKHNQR